MAKKPEKLGKLDTNSVGPGVRQETLKKVEKEKCTLYTWNKASNIEKRAKREKKKHCRTWNIARNTEKLKKKNEKVTLQNLEYGEKH